LRRRRGKKGKRHQSQSTLKKLATIQLGEVGGEQGGLNHKDVTVGWWYKERGSRQKQRAGENRNFRGKQNCNTAGAVRKRRTRRKQPRGYEATPGVRDRINGGERERREVSANRDAKTRRGKKANAAKANQRKSRPGQRSCPRRCQNRGKSPESGTGQKKRGVISKEQSFIKEGGLGIPGLEKRSAFRSRRGESKWLKVEMKEMRTEPLTKERVAR